MKVIFNFAIQTHQKAQQPRCQQVLWERPPDSPPLRGFLNTRQIPMKGAQSNNDCRWPRKNHCPGSHTELSLSSTPLTKIHFKCLSCNKEKVYNYVAYLFLLQCTSCQQSQEKLIVYVNSTDVMLISGWTFECNKPSVCRAHADPVHLHPLSDRRHSWARTEGSLCPGTTFLL